MLTGQVITAINTAVCRARPIGLVWIAALVASGISTAGVMATLSSLSHHERACEQIGDLAGMMQRSPIRAGLLALFLLSLAGFPGTIGFMARFQILSALEQEGHRGLLIVGLGATVLLLAAVGRPLIEMLRTAETRGRPAVRSRTSNSCSRSVARRSCISGSCP